MMYTVRQTEQFQRWLDHIRDRGVQLRIVARLRHAELGNLGDWKSLGDGVLEMRVHAGPGYRLYFAKQGKVLIVMLVGGEKSTQQRDIARARRMARGLER